MALKSQEANKGADMIRKGLEDLKHSLRNGGLSIKDCLLEIEKLLKGMQGSLAKYIRTLEEKDMMFLKSPTGLGIRGVDNWGNGCFKAPRGDHVHRGVDFICKPGQEVVAPITGVIKREARPYAKGVYSGCLIVSLDMDIKMFYFALDKSLIGKQVQKGAVIGYAQDISEKGYPGMTPHIHLEIDLIDPELFLGGNDERSD